MVSADKLAQPLTCNRPTGREAFRVLTPLIALYQWRNGDLHLMPLWRRPTKHHLASKSLQQDPRCPHNHIICAVVTTNLLTMLVIVCNAVPVCVASLLLRTCVAATTNLPAMMACVILAHTQVAMF